MDANVQMVMLISKRMNVTEWLVVACGLFYNSGKYWDMSISKEKVEAEYQKYIKGHVSTKLQDFCIDYLANRIPPNLFSNALLFQNDDRKKTQAIKVKPA